MSRALTSIKNSGTATRDPERTRERILAAALKEFSARGFAGARVDAIARRARINKRMLYHYFGDKEALFREILRRKTAERAAWLAAAPDDPMDILPYWFELASRDTNWIRLLQWEALQPQNGKLTNEKQRLKNYETSLARLGRGQARGLLSRHYDPRQLLLSMMALTTFPLAFPQITRLVTGLAVNNPEFRKRRVAFLRQFARAFRPKG
jgi:TetR/AcrR family transcriptional regulator